MSTPSWPADGPMEIHSHSTVSDGTFEPEHVARLMAERGVAHWSLTDHDTTGGLKRAQAACAEVGVSFISGIEISAQSEGKSIHVLGYGFDPGEPHLASYAETMEVARHERMAEMVERVRALGLEVTLEDVMAQSIQGNVGRPHLARALHARGLVDTPQEAFDRWLRADGPGYVPMAYLSVDDALELIQGAGGMVILAHPGRYTTMVGHLDRWREAGLFALEVRHPSHDLATERRLVDVAQNYGLMMSASNDWHGSLPDDIERLGRVNFSPTWRDAFFDRLAQTTWAHIQGWR
ncbi:PHP domain-containing protein [Bradymonadales bacterium TMQ1]|nr:PHP domain-containing protein [Bradymonadales bacterium TMQ1]